MILFWITRIFQVFQFFEFFVFLYEIAAIFITKILSNSNNQHTFQKIRIRARKIQDSNLNAFGPQIFEISHVSHQKQTFLINLKLLMEINQFYTKFTLFTQFKITGTNQIINYISQLYLKKFCRVAPTLSSEILVT